MSPKTHPFRKRVRSLIYQACRQRMLIIRSGRSRAPITRDQCLKMLNDISVLNSDRQLAKYIISNQQLIFTAIPGVNMNAFSKLKQLLAEAQNHIPQNQNAI